MTLQKASHASATLDFREPIAKEAPRLVGKLIQKVSPNLMATLFLMFATLTILATGEKT